MPYGAFAVDLGGTKCSAALVDQKGRIVARRTVPVDLTSPSGPVVQILQLARDFAGDKSPKSVFVAAAVAVPGLARPSGTVWAPNLPGWERMPLATRLKRSLGIPVVVESDRNAAVLGESWRGAAQGKSDVIVLIIGTGIGAGILSGRRIIRGAHELSGCAGWLTVSGQDVPDDSRVGELEWLTAGPAIARAAQKQLSKGQESILSRLDVAKISAYDVAAAARRGDRLALDIFNTSGRLLGFGVANLVSPRTIVIPVSAFETSLRDNPGFGRGLLIVATNYGITRKVTLLKNVPLGVTTLTLPVVAPVGTVVFI